jgi:uncharacterized protein
MKHFLLFYDVAPDYLERRAALRDAHLEKAWASHRRGELQLGGALADPVHPAEGVAARPTSQPLAPVVDGAVLLFRGETAAVAERFAREDPYVVGGLVARWRVREWITVAGTDAAQPVIPDRAAAPEPIIHRTWRARASRTNAAHYVEHFHADVAPGLRATPGYLDASVVARDVADDEVELVVTTRWRSLDHIRGFADDDLEAAVVQPAARALLRSFDARVVHHAERYRGP